MTNIRSEGPSPEPRAAFPNAWGKPLNCSGLQFPDPRPPVTKRLDSAPPERGRTNNSANWKKQRNPKDSKSPHYHKGKKKLPNTPSTQAQRVCLHETLRNLSGLWRETMLNSHTALCPGSKKRASVTELRICNRTAE